MEALLMRSSLSLQMSAVSRPNLMDLRTILLKELCTVYWKHLEAVLYRQVFSNIFIYILISHFQKSVFTRWRIVYRGWTKFANLAYSERRWLVQTIGDIDPYSLLVHSLWMGHLQDSYAFAKQALCATKIKCWFKRVTIFCSSFS